LVDAHLNSPVPKYSRRFDWIPRAFDSILAKAMAKSPDLRYQTCSEFVSLITRAIG
jgi:serine/threonine-protein kinase